MDDKRFFSRVGFSYFMMVVLTVAVQFLLSLLVSLIAPQAAGPSGYKLAAGYGTAVSGGNPGMCKDDAGAAEHAALPE